MNGRARAYSRGVNARANMERYTHERELSEREKALQPLERMMAQVLRNQLVLSKPNKYARLQPHVKAMRKETRDLLRELKL